MKKMYVMINYIKGIVILTILFLSSGSICSSQENYQNNTGYLSNIKAIAAGGGHSLALDNNGTVWAWGYNGYGQLGNGSSGASHPVPVQVKNLNNIKAIAAGYNHLLALDNNGTVWAWGYNEYGQLGNGTNSLAPQPVPVQVTAGVGQKL